MRKRLCEVLAVMDANRNALMATVDGASGAFASVRPSSDAWSVAENVTHLAMVEREIARLMASSVRWARDNGVAAEISDDSVLGCLDAFSIANPTRAMKAPAVVDVSGEANLKEAVKSLENSRLALRQALADGDGLDLASVTRPHPLLGDLTLYQWALLVAQHEERHRKQIERTLRDVTQRAAECAPVP